MTGRVENNGNSWWNWCCCCGDSASIDGSDREKLNSSSGIEQQDQGHKRSGSPQPTYSQYQTGQGEEPSPMK